VISNYKQNFLLWKKWIVEMKYHDRNKQKFLEIFHYEVMWKAAKNIPMQ